MTEAFATWGALAPTGEYDWTICVRWQCGLMSSGIFWGKGHAWICPTTLCHELCKHGWMDRDAVWVVDSGRPKAACIRWGAQWRHLVNTIELSMCGGIAALTSCYYFW